MQGEIEIGGPAVEGAPGKTGAAGRRQPSYGITPRGWLRHSSDNSHVLHATIVDAMQHDSSASEKRQKWGVERQTRVAGNPKRASQIRWLQRKLPKLLASETMHSGLREVDDRAAFLVRGRDRRLS